MNTLITGCNGFIGSEYIKLYHDKHLIVGVDVVPQFIASDNFEFIAANICDTPYMEDIIRRYKIERVIHTAAEKSLLKCELNKTRAKEVNFDATISLASIAEKYGAKFLFISSDQVFGGSSAFSREDSPVCPINYYGKLKVMAENYLIKIKDCAICRTALVFGDIPDEQVQFFREVRLNSKLIVQGYFVQHVYYCLSAKREIFLPCDEFVSPTHVSLLAEQIEKVLENDAKGILHCCGGERLSRYKMGLTIAKTFDLDPHFIHSDPGTDLLRPKDVSMDSKYTQQILKMRYPSFSEMLQKYNINLLE